MRDQPGGAGETANRRAQRGGKSGVGCCTLTVLGHHSYISSTTVVSLTNKFRNPTSSARIGLVVDMRNLMVSIEQQCSGVSRPEHHTSVVRQSCPLHMALHAWSGSEAYHGGSWFHWCVSWLITNTMLQCVGTGCSSLHRLQLSCQIYQPS